MSMVCEKHQDWQVPLDRWSDFVLNDTSDQLMRDRLRNPDRKGF